MVAPQYLKRLSGIAANYDAILCDAWGVIHDGARVFDGVAEALARFRAERGPVVILTNAPRPSRIIPPQLDRIGLPREAYDSVITSGDATRAEIARRLPQAAFNLGPEKDAALFDDLRIDFVSLEEAAFIICTGLIDDERQTPDDYAELLGRAAKRELTMICANPDIVVRWRGKLIYCAGALAEVYARLGGEVVMCGKPWAPIFELARAAIDARAGRRVAPERILVVGDGVSTDILGANRQGMDALYVAHEGGVHDGDFSADAIASVLANAGARAAYHAAGLKW